ncbi:MAG TPA: AAA family ATPase [Alphaproteobacteria bacterium]|nr:AAA family ATPase [Alphaproteobacteria bacterium]
MRIDLSPMGFRKTPFTREVAVTDRFALPHQTEVADALAEAVHQRMSAALIAPAGTGKTVALRVLVAGLPEARYQVRYVKVTGLSKRDLCREIAAVCGLSPTGIYPALVRKLQEGFAQSADTDGLRPVLVLDESHDLRPESLAMLRLLTNFDMDSRLVVSVVLAGQPPLSTLLRRPDQAAMAQRLAHYATLRLLSRDETRAYVKHRCAVAGADDPFDDEAHEALFEISHGNLRALDHLALKALERAAHSGATAVSTGDVIAARKVLAP